MQKMQCEKDCSSDIGYYNLQALFRSILMHMWTNRSIYVCVFLVRAGIRLRFVWINSSNIACRCCTGNVGLNKGMMGSQGGLLDASSRAQISDELSAALQKLFIRKQHCFFCLFYFCLKMD